MNRAATSGLSPGAAILTGRIGLVGCVKTKLGHAAPARDLYTSPLFRGRRAYVERTCSRWFVLSAKHGLVEPGTVLEPYDVSLDTASSRERRTWSAGVVATIRQQLGALDGLTFEAHAGSNYLDFGLVEGLLAVGAQVVRPAEGLGLFEQRAFYATGTHPRRPAGSEVATRKSHSEGKYAALATRLGASTGATIEIAIAEIDELVGGLPASARKHRAWWANDPSHVQAKEWLGAGWRVVSVTSSSVVFGPGAAAG